MDKKVYPLILFNLVYIIIFAVAAIFRKNYEFLFYVSIVILIFLLLIKKYEKLGLSKGVMWCLSFWGLLHMAGGNVPIGDGVLYGLQLIPKVLRYDQLVHAFGFGTTTILGFQLLKPYLKNKFNWTTISILVVMIGIGAGALNEIIEFMAVLILPSTGVGGYYNTAWDLTFNLIGSLIALVVLLVKEKKISKK